MPNWCYNTAVFSGPKDVIEEIAETKLSLAKLVPWPEELTNYQKVIPVPKSEKKARAALMEKYGYDNLYDWCVGNWGTKWDIGEIDNIEVDEFPVLKNNRKTKKKEYQIYVNFDSAWSPPVDAFNTIYNKYKDRGLEIYLEYIEPGCSFLGTAIGKNGEFKDEYYEYSNLNDLKEIVKKLDHGLGESEVYSMEDNMEYEMLVENMKTEKQAEEQPNKKDSVKKKSVKKSTKKVAAKKNVVKKSTSKKNK